MTVETSELQYSEFVDYETLDEFKRTAMVEAAKTRKLMEALGFRELEWTRGESCFAYEHIDSGMIQGFVIEGLGTLSRAAENAELRAMFNRTYYDAVGESNVNAAINDMVTLGILPYLYALHPAIEDAKQLSGDNGRDLAAGTRRALEEAGCTYGPGETPGLRDIINPGTVCLSGACIGVLRKRAHLMSPQNVKPGMRIVIFESSGVHCNGISLTRKIASERLPKGYLTDIGDGRSFGDVLLTPTRGYARLIRTLQDRGVKTEYCVHISGHGYAKIMRAPQPLTYVIEKLPHVPRIFDFIQEHGRLTLRNMYGTYNMGGGLALLMWENQVEEALATGLSLGIPGINAGYVTEGDRKVVLQQYPDMEPFTKLDLR